MSRFNRNSEDRTTANMSSRLWSVKRLTKLLLPEPSQVEVDLELAFGCLQSMSLCLPAIHGVKPVSVSHLEASIRMRTDLRDAIRWGGTLVNDITVTKRLNYVCKGVPAMEEDMAKNKPLCLEYIVYLACLIWTIDQDLVENEHEALDRWWYPDQLPLFRVPEDHGKLEQCFIRFLDILKVGIPRTNHSNCLI